MDTTYNIDVASLDGAHRQALEDVIGVRLEARQRLIIRVTEAARVEPTSDHRPPQSIDDLANVYEGLTDEEIEAVDRDIKTCANLTRHLP